MADIEAMYNQVKIRNKDKDALRFLCASSATYALRYTTKDDQFHDETIKNIVRRNFYVDVCLKSTQMEEEARHVIKETKTLLSQGGFNLTKFVVNDQKLLEEIPESDRAKEVKVLNPNTGSKALGIHWNVLSDEFYFEMTQPNEAKVTRRRILSVVSSMFDPLGLVSPVLIIGRLLFQEATRLKLMWDQEVPQNIEMAWLSWLKDLSDLDQVRIPRCIKPQDFTDSNSVLELHHFSDASQKAYGCCSYIRCINQNGQVNTALIMSKSRVAPMKQLTVPRLELQAAVLSTRTDAFLRKELELFLIDSHFWSDSEIVLKYIKNETRRFQLFVENRVSIIRQLSSPDKWHHISGQNNPADLISRGTQV